MTKTYIRFFIVSVCCCVIGACSTAPPTPPKPIGAFFRINPIDPNYAPPSESIHSVSKKDQR